MMIPMVDRIVRLCNAIPQKLRSISASDLSAWPAPGKWSKKEILGHLVDSAANNHQRFVRGQYEALPVIFYDQDEWNRLQHYNSESAEVLIGLWEAYNRHLAHVIAQIPEEGFSKQCAGKNGSYFTLGFLITDYVEHMEHHLEEIVGS